MSTKVQLVGFETEFGIAERGLRSHCPNPERAWRQSMLLVGQMLGRDRDVDWLPLDEGAGDVLDQMEFVATDYGGFDPRTGARIYVDHAHPEWASPACRSPHTATLYDKVGEWRAEWAAIGLALDAEGNPGRRRLELFKNNTSGSGDSYGCHVNVSWPADFPRGRFTRPLASLHTVLQILAGTGSLERIGDSDVLEFWISQRGRHIYEECSSETTRQRPIVNTRDEPLDRDHSRRRMHNIPQDSNLSEVATYLKAGLIMIGMQVITDAAWPHDYDLVMPVLAFRAVAADPTLTVQIQTRAGGMTGLAVLRHYVEAFRAYFVNRPILPWQDDVLGRTELLLDILATDMFAARSVIEWIMKLWLMTGIQRKRGLADNNFNHLQIEAVNLQYHSLIREPALEGDRKGLYFQLRDNGHMERLFTDAQIIAADGRAPRGTSSHTRAMLLWRYREQPHYAAWDYFKVTDPHGLYPDGNATIMIEFRKASAGTPRWFKDVVGRSPTAGNLRHNLVELLGPDGGTRGNVSVSFSRYYTQNT